MPKKSSSLSFADLGLSTPLPKVLAKTREERRKDQREERQEKKQRTKAATLEVAAARHAASEHKEFVREEEAKQKELKEHRKQELRIENLKARNERDEEAKKQAARRLVSQQKIIAEMIETKREEAMETKRIRELIENETRQKAKVAPKNVHIQVHRTEEIDAQRVGLPVLQEEQPIVEAINASCRTCVLICGETGSGKTTQIPQFLWEAGYGHKEGATLGRDGCILVTEPRRVAAVSMAKRVAEELNVQFGGEVCYHVRYDNNLSPDCRLKFATEGIVLKEIQSDFLLKKYSVIVVDEAHERSISCDILIGLLSRIIPLRNDLFQEELASNGGQVAMTKVKPLKLVIMSATMRVTDFKDNSTLFPIVPPLINVEARRYPVTNHFARRTELKEYVDQAFEKVRQVHKKLPPGGILVFLSTQQEIEDLCGRLRQHYAKTKIEYYEDSYSKHHFVTRKHAEVAASSDDDDRTDTAGVTPQDAAEMDEYGLAVDDYTLDGDDNGGNEAGAGTEVIKNGRLQRSRPAVEKRGRGSEVGREDDGADTEASIFEEGEGEVNGEYDTLHVLPLYALLDFRKQQEVFKAPPSGKRLCVVATNVAETSITIPNIKYVVDAGRVKTKTMDGDTNASCFRIEWTSQASAEQRSGRAGRMGPGHCYRLYSTAVYVNLMSKHSAPEILRTPLDSVVLLMKHLRIEHVGGFPFPSPPREEDLKSALDHLAVIDALESSRNYTITKLGRELVAYPVPPRFARAIVEVKKLKQPRRVREMVALIVAVVTTTTNVLTAEGSRLKSSRVEEGEAADPRQQRIRSLLNAGSDFMTYLNALVVFRRDPRRSTWDYCLVQKSMQEANLLYSQLRRFLVDGDEEDTEELADTLDDNEAYGPSSVEGAAAEPTTSLLANREEELVIRKAFIPGLLDQVARRATVQECRTFGVDYNDKRTSKAPYLILSTRTISYIHPTSSVSRTFPPPDFVTFGFLQKVVRSETKKAQSMMLGVTIVTSEWLHTCGFTDPTS